MSDSTKPDIAKLNDEGDFGADYIEELLNIADLDGDIEISVEADRPSVAVVTEGAADRRLKRLIGQDGEVLDALQELTRLAVQAKTGERSRLMLDIVGFRENHRQEIAAIANEAVASVLSSGESVSLDPMNPFERKVVHDIAAAAGLVSDSEGVGAARHVVVKPAGEEGGAGRTADSSESAESGDSAESSESADSGDSAESAPSGESGSSAESAESAE